jgi:hypothetical protein
MGFTTDLEIVITEDFIIGVDVEIDYTIEHDSIGWYEYGGAKYYDDGDYQVVIDEYTVINTEDYQYTKQDQDFINSNNLIEWLQENDEEQYEWILDKIYDYENDPKNHF